MATGKCPPMESFKDAWIKVDGRWFFINHIPRLNGEHIEGQMTEEGTYKLWDFSIPWSAIEGMRH